MLPKSQRLTTEQVSAVIKDGKSFQSPFFTVRVLKSPNRADSKSDFAAFAVIVSKKIAKTAVARNLARRRVYEAIKLSGVTKTSPTSTIPTQAFSVVILCKTTAIGADLKILIEDLKTLFKKAYEI